MNILYKPGVYGPWNKQSTIMAANSFSVGLIASGFSASTGLDIRCPDDQRWDILDDEPRLSGESIRGHEFRTARFGGGGTESEAEPGAQASSQAGPVVIKLGIDDLFHLSCTAMLSPPTTTAESFSQSPVRVHVHMLKSPTHVDVDVNLRSTVKDLRREAAGKLGLPQSQHLTLFSLDGSQLEDHREIGHLGIAAHGVVYGIQMQCLAGGGQPKIRFELDDSLLDPRYDYDFTNKADDGKTYRRGNYTYQRPYGWQRYAVKVRGLPRYKNDTWLGKDGIRTASTPGEWPVSYHGTRRCFLEPILDKGYKIGSRKVHGAGIYTSPSLEKVAKYYAKTFPYEGKKYQLVLQNRVDPDHLKIIPPETTGIKDFPYWLSPLQDPDHGVYHVRPYGILAREVK